MSATTGPPPSAGTPLPGTPSPGTTHSPLTGTASAKARFSSTARPPVPHGAPAVPRPRTRPLDRSWEDLDLPARVQQLMPRARGDLAELVALRSVAGGQSAELEECNQAARWVLGRFEEVGFTDAFLAETMDDSRAVVGSTPPNAEAAVPRVLLYAHYDVHPAGDEEAWRTPPFTLTEVDGRWYARGSADCKGNVLAHLTALRALGDLGGVDLRLLVTGSDEQGGDVLKEFLNRHADLLRADVVLVCDTLPWREPPAGAAHGPAYQALLGASVEAAGEARPLPVRDCGGNTCQVFADAFPDAEVLALGVADRDSSVHRPNESLDPRRLQATALTEALFLRALAAAGRG